jgi:hypothetical protein
MSNPTTELWDGIRGLLLADSGVMALVNNVYDKRPDDSIAFAAPKQACISRGPVSGGDDSADCIPGAEITLQLDVWCRKPNRWVCDDIVFAVRRALHGKSGDLGGEQDSALVEMRVDFWQVVDDPDPLTQHGIVQVTAIVEEPEEV